MATDNYEVAMEASLKEYDTISSNNELESALSMSLPNEGDSIDYDGWLSGADDFVADHKAMLHTVGAFV